jgi:putative tricarboxylic transport membrane protein
VTESAANGDVRILAVTSEEAVEGVDAPTLTDEGVDLVFANWRGIVAAPDITDDEKQKLVDAITEMHESDAWQKVLEDQGWTDSFVSGDDFSSFLGDESKRVEGVMSELGLA